MDNIKRLTYTDNVIDLSQTWQTKSEILHAASRVNLTGKVMAVMVIDFYNPKIVRRLQELLVADDIFEISARQISSWLELGDSLFRLSTSKIALTLTNVADEQNARSEATLLAKKIIDEFSHFTTQHTYTTTLSPCIGIAIYPTDAENIVDLIEHADSANCHARLNGSDNYTFFSNSMKIREMRLLKLDSLLRRALSQAEFALNYQPQVNFSGKIVGIEALLRWNSPTIGNISPEEFIPLAEENGMIIPIGEWVIRTACLQRKYWLDNDLCDSTCYIAINVSPYQLRCSDFAERITEIVSDVGISPNQVDIEITEGILINNLKDISTKLSELRRIGFRISVDDFGTGYSSLAYLKHLPIDAIKIDRSFVNGIGTNHSDEAISLAIINLAKNLDIDVIAEGVETGAQVQFLKSNACEGYQGYFFNQPVSAAEIASLLQEQNAYPIKLPI